MATITDKIMSPSTGLSRPNPTTLTVQKGIGDSILTADDLTGWGTSTAVPFVLYKVDTSGNEIINTRSDWKGIVSGNTITQLTLTAGSDTIYPIGSPVIAAATARYGDDLAAALLSSHNQNGTIKDGAIATSMIADGAVTNAKLSTTAGQPGGSWSTWTPTWSNLTIGNAVVTARYRQIGKTVEGYIKVVFGSTSVMGASPTFTAPVTAASQYGSGAYNFIGIGYAEDAGVAALNCGAAFNASTSAISILTMNTAGTYGNWVPFGASVPLAWNNGDFFNLTFEYEAA